VHSLYFSGRLDKAQGAARMNHWEMESAIHVAVTLKDAGFEVSQICCSRMSCFDFAANKFGNVVLIKIVCDIDSYPRCLLRELKIVASHINASPLLVSQMSHGKPLEDDTVYSRSNINIVNVNTLQSFAQQTGNPLVTAGPGGYTAQLYGGLVKRRREQLGLSIGKLAALVGVSRRAIYGYEHGLSKASIISAIKLTEALGVPLVKPIDLLEKHPVEKQCLLMKSKRDLITRLLLNQILKKFGNCDITPIHNAPFDFILNVPNDNYLIIGAAATEQDTDVKSRVNEILSICQIIYAYPVLITENRKNAKMGLSCFSVADLSVLHSPEELIAI
jgi:putative transcriptional regulator